ncbi:hypothetical protein PUNSTDRAFT_133949 [Punctularia strigosozonata HHB-11173 SS5]|uniref:uncharacterized protein n=1 Tax=Punctularia strigosozonata (strain HHB-11173) TaxID=741275 RepID=UPI0004416AB5|nr:uncharacterized protein PUNSTDRAFT_133949 [Punctularia strigosozonata HHB-11173 SS5]EIN08768.1 hypothetical protein PUNSTDRAFT_133949 [Punctularia strigosozonata HHB-11173 SS5]
MSSGQVTSVIMSTKTDDIQGSCNCGSITVTLKEGFVEGKHAGVACHCLNCQKTTGSLFAYLLPVSRSDFTISDPSCVLRTYAQHGTDSGKPMYRQFCGNCGSSILSLPDSEPDGAYLKLSLFGNDLPPAVELYTDFAKPWEKSLAEHRFPRAST